MKIYVLNFASVILSLFCCLPASAQIVFGVADLPVQPGGYYLSYVATNVSVSALLGGTNGPQRWDFSRTLASVETIQRIDVVLPGDDAYASDFPDATYALRLTDESDGSQSWEFYGVTTNFGRLFYGTDDPLGGEEVFQPPALDLPDSLRLGSNWNWSAPESADFISITLSSIGRVDAYGTLVLPNVGEIPALRVNQVNAEQLTINYAPYGPPEYTREYYWLVKGIGKAVDIFSSSSTTVPSANFASAQTVYVAFQASTLNPAAGLGIQVQNGQAFLHWMQATNGSGYLVQDTGTLTGTNWQFLGASATNAWSDTLTATQRFYRVLLQP
jgi:hypothetical protein